MLLITNLSQLKQLDGMEEESNITAQIWFWVLFSAVSSAIFARYSRGLCAFLFLSFAWIYIWILFTQAWATMERDPNDIAFIAVGSLVGWTIGTFFVWKSRGWNKSFFEN